RNLEDALAVPLVTRLPLTEYAIGRVQIDGPAPIGHRVGMRALLDQVPLREHEIPFETTAFPLTRYHPHPFERHRIRLGKFPRVLDVIPNAVYHPPKLPFDAFGVMYCIQAPAMLHPPQLAAMLVGFEVAEPGDFLRYV